jgi:hypothetical protein
MPTFDRLNSRAKAKNVNPFKMNVINLKSTQNKNDPFYKD